MNSEIAAASNTSLNPRQLEAVLHEKGPILVLAGAGSGKTRVLTHRIAHLITARGFRPQQIMAVTFTNKAAKEMGERLHTLLGEDSKGVVVGTFHSIGLRILRRQAEYLNYKKDFVIYDDQDSRGVMKRLMKAENLSEKDHTPQYFLGMIDNWKNAGVLPHQAAQQKGNFKFNLAVELYDKYQRALLASQAMDFGDLLLNTVTLFKRQPAILSYYQEYLHHLLVDEFQDTNPVQYQLVRMLAGGRKNLLVVGDDDQSIYSFRGATIQNILDFEKDYPGAKSVTLDQNYRSTNTILSAANSVIAHNSERRPKKLWTAGETGNPIKTFVAEDEQNEAEFVVRTIAESLQELGRTSAPISYDAVAVFYRTNAQSRALEDALVSAGIPYRIFGGLKFYDRKEIKDILSYLKLLVNPFDEQSFSRVINTPPRGLGAVAVNAILEHAAEHRGGYIEACRELASRSKPIAAFVALYASLANQAATVKLSKLISAVLHETNYLERLKGSEGEDAASRVENLNELVAIGSQMELSGDTPLLALSAFLDRVALTSSAEPVAKDDPNGPQGAVSLSTLHLAKGLEFPIVFFTGLEDGLVPHYRSFEKPKDIEEERRLCYVGITRAMQQLVITRSRRREMFASGGPASGTSYDRTPSRFLGDIPDALLLQLNGSIAYEERYHYDYSDRDDSDDYLTTFNFKKPKPAKADPNQLLMKAKQQKSVTLGIGAARSAALQGMIKAGDALNQELSRPLVNPKDLQIGLAVSHPSFGVGKVTAIDGNLEEDPDRARISICFGPREDGSTETKRLMVKYARLSPAHSSL